MHYNLLFGTDMNLPGDFEKINDNFNELGDVRDRRIRRPGLRPWTPLGPEAPDPHYLRKVRG
jgi:hypothetical protein